MKLIQIEGGVCAAQGFKANGVHCGIRKNKTKKDFALIVAEKECATACVYTTNLVKGAPILVTKEHQVRFINTLFSSINVFTFIVGKSD